MHLVEGAEEDVPGVVLQLGPLGGAEPVLQDHPGQEDLHLQQGEALADAQTTTP